jgi:2-polyprenyl-3-methyl-5-hydroxy-6-metoxy-1,4-benzoquinol methylase
VEHILETIEKCPICDSTNFSHFLDAKDHTVSNKSFSILQCDDCNFKFTSPRPKEKDCGYYYQSEDYISHSNAKKGFINQLYQLARNITLKQKYGLIKKQISGKRLLDYGCGTGEFLNYCQKKGLSVSGVEPSKNASEQAKKNYNLTVNNLPYFYENDTDKYDCITLWHVLEHVYDLNKALASFKERLNENGTLIIALPNPDSFDATFYKKYWAAYDVPRHIWHFNQKTITKLTEKQGFKLKTIRPMLFDSFYISLLSEKYKKNVFGMIRAFFIGLFSNATAYLFGKSYSSQIYIFKQN